jgi:hypothetical protein
VDTLGLSIAVVVTDAGTDDRLSLVELLTQYFADGSKRLCKVWVDGAYPAAWLAEWGHGLQQPYKIALEATLPTAGRLPRGRAVERTFAGRLNGRRHSRGSERLTANSTAMSQTSMIRPLLNRLA